MFLIIFTWQNFSNFNHSCYMRSYICRDVDTTMFENISCNGVTHYLVKIDAQNASLRQELASNYVSLFGMP